jgi:hypothetical protein
MPSEHTISFEESAEYNINGVVAVVQRVFAPAGDEDLFGILEYLIKSSV